MTITDEQAISPYSPGICIEAARGLQIMAFARERFTAHVALLHAEVGPEAIIEAIAQGTAAGAGSAENAALQVWAVGVAEDIARLRARRREAEIIAQEEREAAVRREAAAKAERERAAQTRRHGQWAVQEEARRVAELEKWKAWESESAAHREWLSRQPSAAAVPADATC